MRAFFVRVNADTDDDVQHVYDLLETGQLRGDVVPEQDYSPTLGISLVDHIVYVLSRINTKLDNLGQLRHLYKIQKELSDLTTAVEELQKPLAYIAWPSMKEYARDMIDIDSKVIAEGGTATIAGGRVLRGSKPSPSEAMAVVMKAAADKS